MKKVFLILFLVFFLNGFAQTREITIILKDADSNLPIEDATIYVLKTKQSLMSNAEGKVSFELTGTSNIQISHTSYVGVTVRSTTLKSKENVITLKSSVNNLDEIIITRQHPQKILKTLIENSIKKLSVPARLKVYSREFFKLNGTYSYYNDGLMNFQISGKGNDFQNNILVEQNRSYGLIDKEVSADLLGYDLNNIMENYYEFKYLNPLLEIRAKKEYDFVVKGYATNSNYYLISAIPTDKASGLADDFTIIYDKNKKIIIEVSSNLSPTMVAKEKEKTAVGSKNTYKSLFKTIYRLDGDDYYLISSKEEIGFDKIEKTGSKSIEVCNYFITTNFSQQKYSFKESDVFKDKTLFNKTNTILTDYWNTSGIIATEEEQQIITKIEAEN